MLLLASNERSAEKLIFFAFVAVFPIAAAAILKPIVYDGTRLFLFVIPPLAVLAGIGLSTFFSLGLPKTVKSVFAAGLVLVALLTAYDMIRTHPYEYVFFNRTSGGLRAAYGRFETEYWGTSYKEGMDWLSRNYKQDAPSSTIRIANTSNPFLTSYYITSRPDLNRFVQVGLRDNPDVVLSITRWNQHLDYPGRVLHVVSRMNTPLLYVIETSSSQSSEKDLMQSGLDLLYTQNDPGNAANEFRKVLLINPNHYGATFQLATALDKLKQRSDADSLWSKVLEMAIQYSDTSTIAAAKERLRPSRR
jgi:hypothetical protein